jgi:hypothetical protein
VDNDPYKYHLFAAAFTNHCGLNAWKSNSEVIHAVSNSPVGPFEFHDVALPVWHHNPQIVRHTDGTYLLFSIGLSPEPKPANCTKDDIESEVDDNMASQELIQLHYSNSIYGPWTMLLINGNSNLFDGTNPTPWVNPDGSLYVGSHSKDFTVSMAPHWKGPYSAAKVVFQPDGVYNIEDPFLWFDSKAQKWKVLLHQYNATDTKNQVRVGGYAESATSDIYGAWTLQSNETPAYNITVHFTDSTTINYTRRERPKLLFNPDGTPSILYNGVCYQNSDCYTIAEQIKN